MTEYEAAMKLLDLVLRVKPDALQDKDRILALYRECLDAVRGKAE
jgi:hypothetical protein